MNAERKNARKPKTSSNLNGRRRETVFLRRFFMEAMKMNDEVWKDIPGYEGKYQASNLGRIKSLTRKVRGINHYTGNEFARTIPECILKPGRYCKAGHVSVVLGHGTAGKPVHQLIMLAFVGPPPHGCEVLHTDGNPKNNALLNLRYGSRTDNILDVYRQGRKWRRLSVSDVEEIKFGLWCGYTLQELAVSYGVSISAISCIKTGRTFSWAK